MSSLNISNKKKYLKKMFNLDSLATFVLSILRLLLLLGLAFIIIFPLLSITLTAFMRETDLYDPTVTWIPKNWTLFNFWAAYFTMDYPRALWNTFSLTFLVSIAQLLSCTIVGYGFARFNIPFKKIAFGLVILTLLVPPQVIMVPLYLNFRFFNIFGLLGEEGVDLINSYWPYALISLTGVGYKNGLFIYIMRQFFKGMPDTLEESAYVDGATPLQTFFRIMLPGALPAIIIVFLFAFVWQWNDLFYFRLFLRNTGNYLSSNLLNIDPFEWYNEAFGSAGGAHIDRRFVSVVHNAGMLLVISPLLILYMGLQRYFVESIERTGIVG
ncbi:MAG: carbohydrate ABC transporter permease [Bacillota bacterium]